MAKTVTYSFGKVTIHDNYIITVMNEGITVLPSLNDTLEDIAYTYFFNKKFVYITHRKNSYAVDPSIYFRTSKIPNLIGIAIVSGDKIIIDNSELESKFFDKPFKKFNKLNDAIAWANQLCLD